MVKFVPSSRTCLDPPGEGGRHIPASHKLWSYIKNEDLQMGLVLELFDLRLLTSWAWWFSPGNCVFYLSMVVFTWELCFLPGHGGFHPGMVAENLIQVGFEGQIEGKAPAFGALPCCAGCKKGCVTQHCENHQLLSPACTGSLPPFPAEGKQQNFSAR